MTACAELRRLVDRVAFADGVAANNILRAALQVYDITFAPEPLHILSPVETGHLLQNVETVVGYLLSVLLAAFLGSQPAAPNIDTPCCRHCPFIDKMGIVHIALHIDTVGDNVQMGNSRAAVSVECHYILTVSEVRPCRTFAASTTGHIDPVELLHEVIRQPFPAGVRPPLRFVPGRGDLNAYGIVLQWAMTAQFRLELFLMNDHSLPDAFEGNIVRQEVQLDDFSFILFSGVTDGICAM